MSQVLGFIMVAILAATSLILVIFRGRLSRRAEYVLLLCNLAPWLLLPLPWIAFVLIGGIVIIVILAILREGWDRVSEGSIFDASRQEKSFISAGDTSQTSGLAPTFKSEKTSEDSVTLPPDMTLQKELFEELHLEDIYEPTPAPPRRGLIARIGGALGTIVIGLIVLALAVMTNYPAYLGPLLLYLTVGMVALVAVVSVWRVIVTAATGRSVEAERPLTAPTEATAPPRLLILRVFGDGNASNDILAFWKKIGGAFVLAGPDLLAAGDGSDKAGLLLRSLFNAEQALDDYARQGRLARTEPELQRALAQQFPARGEDTVLLCGHDVWRGAILTMMSRTDFVIFDVSGFDEGNAGSAFELETLIDCFPLNRVLFLSTTNADYFKRLAQTFWAQRDSQGPNGDEMQAVEAAPFTILNLPPSLFIPNERESYDLTVSDGFRIVDGLLALISRVEPVIETGISVGRTNH